jgi:16S rRNA processing protein RimM
LEEVDPDFVTVARVLGAWGVRGAVKVEPLAPKQVLSDGRTVYVAGQPLRIKDGQRSGRFVRLTLDGVESREAAAALRNSALQVPESDLDPLPEGQFYRFQLLGLRVIGAGGEELGRVTDVFSAPENDVYVVQGDRGEVLIPAIDDVVQEIDLKAGEITIEIIPGLLP